MDELKILGVSLKMDSYDEVVSLIVKSAQKEKSLTVAPVAIHPPLLARFDKDYKRTLNSLDLVLPDSFWHLWGINFLYGKRYKKRFYGPYFMRDIIKKAKKEGLNTYLFGGRSKRTLEKLKKRFDKYEGKGKIHGYEASFSIDDKEIDELVRKIKGQTKGILFVGIGSPLQHRLIKKLGERLNMPVVAVGAAFGFLSGEEKMAPESWRKNGFEWLFRLKEEPKRLTGRYLISLLFFPFLFWEKIKRLI